MHIHRLAWAFAGRTYHIVGNHMLRLICASTWDFGTHSICLKSQFNPFETNGIFYKATNNRGRMVYCIYWGVTGYNFKRNIVFFLKINCLSKQCRYWWNAILCGISSGSSLFAEVSVYGFQFHKWLYLGFQEATFSFTFGKYFNKIGKISAKIHAIGKIKAIFGLGMTPI